MIITRKIYIHEVGVLFIKFLDHLESAILDWLILYHSCFLSYIKEKFNTGADQESENIMDHQSPKSAIKEHADNVAESDIVIPAQRDYRFWIVLGIIVLLVLAIIVKLRLRIEDRYVC